MTILEMNRSSSRKNSLGCSVSIKMENYDKYCFFWSNLARLHPSENTNPIRISNYTRAFFELNIDEFDFSNGFKCSDVNKCEKPKSFSMNLSELCFFKEENN